MKPAAPFQLDAADLALLAVALEQFANHTAEALRSLPETRVLRTTRHRLEQQIAQAETLLLRVNKARQA